jgi:hypothetical protein
MQQAGDKEEPVGVNGESEEPVSEKAVARRQAVIAVRDVSGRPIKGAVIDVYMDGQRAASITSSGISTIEISNASATLEVEVSAGNQSRRVLIPPGQDHVDMEFDEIALTRSFAKPGGRCPDGTSGQPCVTCQIGKDQIRVCG